MQRWKGTLTIEVDLRVKNDDEAMEILSRLINSAMETTLPLPPRHFAISNTHRHVQIVEDDDPA